MKILQHEMGWAAALSLIKQQLHSKATTQLLRHASKHNADSQIQVCADSVSKAIPGYHLLSRILLYLEDTQVPGS